MGGQLCFSKLRCKPLSAKASRNQHHEWLFESFKTFCFPMTHRSALPFRRVMTVWFRLCKINQKLHSSCLPGSYLSRPLAARNGPICWWIISWSASDACVRLLLKQSSLQKRPGNYLGLLNKKSLCWSRVSGFIVKQNKRTRRLTLKRC